MVDLLKCVFSNLLLLLKVDAIKKPALHKCGFFNAKSLCESLFYKHDFWFLTTEPTSVFTK